MLNLSLKDLLERLGLKQSEFARLIEMSPRTVSLWATGESPLPGPVAAYLRVLQLLPTETRAEEFRRVQGRSKMIDEGLYNVEYRSPEQFGLGPTAASGSALAVVRNGKILGSDRWGAVFMGSYEFDPVSETNAVHRSAPAKGFAQTIDLQQHVDWTPRNLSAALRGDLVKRPLLLIHRADESPEAIPRGSFASVKRLLTRARGDQRTRLSTTGSIAMG